ncbi:Crp/Fnr family transcriptional regulator [Streptomyces sp. JV180]|uniref:Crp/Fnr family transcriptional regulator n=1 Tax=Streptomyces sp. JV180 TaxID=858634 RepID=UPI00168AE0AB|nr:Crp/Fnr family transcriptional regulator [Streptomyces sp. JV180]MBD3550577.1 Crp/Fnr family transcriptional regulator [Streptomyces sp. JV180]
MSDIMEYPPEMFRPWAQHSTDVYLKSLGLPPYTIDSLMSLARISGYQDGDVVSYGQEWIHIITRGIVKETTSHGTVRLWRRGMILGDISRVMLRKPKASDSNSLGTGSHLTFLGNGATLSLTARTFAMLIEREPVLALLLAQLTNERSQIVEAVYATSKASPIVRVARLLDYLAQRTRGSELENRLRWTRTGIHPVPDGALTLTGPSQAEIAVALGLGRTTVEKAIAALRADGILNALEPGTRSNRYYEIMDHSHLKSLARSES